MITKLFPNYFTIKEELAEAFLVMNIFQRQSKCASFRPPPPPLLDHNLVYLYTFTVRKVLYCTPLLYICTPLLSELIIYTNKVGKETYQE